MKPSYANRRTDQKTYETSKLMAGFNSTQYGVSSMGWLAEWQSEPEVVTSHGMWPKFFGWYWHHIISTMVMASCTGPLAHRINALPVCESDYYLKAVDECQPTTF